MVKSDARMNDVNNFLIHFMIILISSWISISNFISQHASLPHIEQLHYLNIQQSINYPARLVIYGELS